VTDKIHSSSVIKSDKLSFSPEPVLVKKEKNKKGEVKINLEKEGDIVRAIEIICSCGNKIKLLCEYENEIAQQD